MMAFSLVSICILIALAAYVVFNEQREVELYCDKVTNATNLMAKTRQAHFAQDFVESSKKNISNKESVANATDWCSICYTNEKRRCV